MIKTFEISVSYAQVAVFNSTLEFPFNNWSPQHVAQGFSWRPGSVSFKTLDESGGLYVDIEISNNPFKIRANTLRAICVPFSVGPEESIDVSSIDQGIKVNIPKGEYALIFETGRGIDNLMWSYLTFIPSSQTKAEILKADSGLSVRPPLLMEALPAKS
jgi:Competence protein J (ComJ)